MTDFKASDRDVSRAIRSWLHEDRHEDFSRIAGAVLDQVETTPQRRATWWPARRTQTMSKIVGFAAAAAAVVVAVVLGTRLLGPAAVGPGAGPTASPSASAAAPTPEPSVAARSASPDFLSEGSHVLTDASFGVLVTVSISASGWYGEPAEGILVKNENVDPPDGAGLITFAGEVDGWYVPGDPCHYEATMPDAAAATVDEFVAALAAQASRDASAPVDITVGGYVGKSITLHVPNDAVFSSCDNGKFCSWGNPVASPSDPCFRYHQGPGQIDELSIVDVNGELVIIDAGHYEDTPQTDLDELRAIVDSATFGQ